LRCALPATAESGSLGHETIAGMSGERKLQVEGPTLRHRGDRRVERLHPRAVTSGQRLGSASVAASQARVVPCLD
jgi:hypothetical protein